MLTTTLFNAAQCHEADHGAGRLYALVEASVSARIHPIGSGTGLPYSMRPFVEAEWYHVSGARRPVTADGRSTFASVSAGSRIFTGGEQMRMGAAEFWTL